MSKKIVLVGHCGPDSSFLRMTVARGRKDVTVLSADDDAALQALLADGVALLLVNRVLDYGFATDSGIELIAALHRQNPSLKMMLVSNYEEAQRSAVAAGALPGFGKNELRTPRIGQILDAALALETFESSKPG